MISKTTLTIMMIALSSVTAQNVRFIPNDEQYFIGTPFGINNRPNIAPSLFNGLSGFNGIISNPAFQFNNGNNSSTSTGTFNANNGTTGTFTSTNVNNAINGLTNNGTTFTGLTNTINGLTGLTGLNGLNGFTGVNNLNGLTGLNNVGTVNGATNVAPVSSNTGPINNTGNGLAANGINGGAGPFVGTNGTNNFNNNFGNLVNANGTATLAGVTITNGLTSLGQANLGISNGRGFGLSGLDGTIVTNDGTFINSRQNLNRFEPNGTPLDRANGFSTVLRR